MKPETLTESPRKNYKPWLRTLRQLRVRRKYNGRRTERRRGFVV